MTPEIVGREAELASLRTFLEPSEGGPAALVLEGEPGIGKSTLWLAGVEEARERDFRVLSSRPAEAERGLAHAGLGDLFDGVLDDVLPDLSPPRRRALEIALLVEEASGDPVDRRALAVAVRGALQALSRSEPLVIAIDDVQWLDPSSTSALAFALRRLDEADVRRSARAAARRRHEAVGAGVCVRCRQRSAAQDRTPQRRRPPSAAARPPGPDVSAPDAAPDPRTLGRQPVLRARSGSCSRRRRRPARAASRS